MSLAPLAAPLAFVASAGAAPLRDFLEALGGVLHGLLDLPVQASKTAPDLDALQYVQFGFMWILGIATFGATGWFVLRYRRSRRRGVVTPELRAPLWLEGGFAVFLLAFFVLFWVVGFRQYVRQTVAPDDALEVYVTAKQWVWKFTYPDGQSSAGVLYVPRDQPVRVILTSRDVIHSFFVPAFRVKQDAVPGRYTSTWFTPTREGRYDLLCAEFCGAGHSRMWGEVVVLPEEQFGLWLEGREPDEPLGPVAETPITSAGGRRGERRTLAARGMEAAAVAGCLRCHTTDGTEHIGPTWRGLYGSEVHLEGGTTVKADEAYLTESMMDPMAKIVAGYQPVMPTFQGRLDAAEAAAILHYMKSLRGPQPGPGEELPAELPALSEEALERARGEAGREPPREEGGTR